VITSYNYEAFLADAIESVLVQDYPAFEVIVADNASTDGSRSVIERYANDPRVRPIFNERNIGRNANYNLGWRESRGEYVLYLSADDFLLPGHLDALEDLLHRNPEADLTYARAVDVDANGRPIRLNSLLGVVDVASYGPGRNELAELLAFSSFMWLPTMLFPRRLLEEVGGFDDTIDVASDYDLQLRLVAQGKRVAFLNRVLVAIRFHGANPSGDGYARSGDLMREYVRIYERILAPGPTTVREREHGIVAMLRGYLRNVAPENLPTVARECGPAIERITTLLLSSAGRALEPEPLVTVIVPTAGRLGYLADALDSLVAQTYTRWEAVVIDDGTADLAPLFTRLERDRRVRFVRTIGPSGPAEARNAALRLSSGTIVAYLDDDDRFAPDHLAGLVAAITGGADVAVADAELVVDVPESAWTASRVVLAREPLEYPPEAWGLALAVAPCIRLTAIGHRRNVVDRFGAFATGLHADEAWDFLARMAPKTRAVFTRRRTAELRWRPGLFDQVSARRLQQAVPLTQFVQRRAPGDDPRVPGARDRYLTALSDCIPGLRDPATAVDATRRLARLATTAWLVAPRVLQAVEERT
jgi:glycosyltransferase involved in cell wall biosynthesis